MNFKRIVLVALLAMIGFQPVYAGTKDAVKHMHKLFLDAASGKNKNVVYIVSGDSTRDNKYALTMEYYVEQFAKINVKVVKNASSGETAEQWNTNTRKNASLNDAIKKTVGDGENTIMEYSFGINDQARGASREEQKKRYKKGVVDYLAAKPKATVILAVPVAHKNNVQNEELKSIYEEIASELNLILVDVLIPTKDVLGDSKYYFDWYHPNRWGSKRFVNYIFDQILPEKLHKVVTVVEAPKGKAVKDVELYKGFEKGYYIAGGNKAGKGVNDKLHYRMKEIKVEPNFVLKVQHSGNRYRVCFMSKKKKFISCEKTRALRGKKHREIVIPQGAYFMRANIAAKDEKYNPNEDDISVKYDLGAVHYMSLADIHKGLKIRLKKAKK